MRVSRGVPNDEIEKYLAIWKSDCAYYELALSKKQVYESEQVVPIPSFVKKPDYEFEIACLLDADVRGPLSLVQAEEFVKSSTHITILNDFSARDLQEQDRQLGLGVARSKSVLGKAIGPRFVPAKDLKLSEIKLRLKVNGQVRTETNYGTCFWTFPKILSHLSNQNIFLERGTLIGSGTVGGGSIAEFGGKYPWLLLGDLVEMEASEIGTLKNKIGAL